MIPLRFDDYEADHIYIDIYTHGGVRLGHFKRIFGKSTYKLSCVEEGLDLEQLEQIVSKLKELNNVSKEARS